MAIPVPELTAAQRRVLEALCRPWLSGASAAPAGNSEIADALVVSEETVKSHLRALFARLRPRGRGRAAQARRARPPSRGRGRRAPRQGRRLS